MMLNMLRTSWHDCKGVAAFKDALDDWQLQTPEGVEAKSGAQRSCQSLLRHSFL
jgi:hypothetical protein